MSTEEFDSIVTRHDLNEHPFYVAWRAGTLPRAKLAAYASDYAPFIESIEIGWRTLGRHDHADGERRHAQLWHRFREALGTSSAAPCPEAQALVAEARRSFGDAPEALGALYAFESQQPSTARSKLDGLRAHYEMDDETAAYFRLHADDCREREELRALAARLAPVELARARAACERACEAMWSALDGLLRECEAA
jgi:pyrroloquinoline-quinone synthase